LLLTLMGAPAAAQNSQVVVNGGQVSGAGTINIAAGTGNAQANAGALAQGQQASTDTLIIQHIEQRSGDSTRAAAIISDGAFANSSGWLAVSAAAGNDNQQANVAAFAFGTEAGTAGDLVLSQSRASQEPTGGPRPSTAPGERTANIGATAFSGSSGLVQVSLIGGDRNTSANVFALSVSGGANP
jgi:hypothetical protein